MPTSTLIMWIAVFFLLGWLWSYFFLRQILYNFIIALPLIKKMNGLKEELIAIGAKRYTLISNLVCSILAAILLFLVIRFARLALILAFASGAVVSFVMLFGMVTPKNRAMFETFCNAYYSFIPDDELRTAVYNKDLSKIRSRLKAMDITGTFIPEFQKR